MRGCPTEVDLGRSGPAKSLVGTEVGVVDEAQLDRLSEVLGDQGAQEFQSEATLQGPPEPFDQGDRALLADRSKALLGPKPPEPPAEQLSREAARPIRDEMGRAPMAFWPSS